MPKDHLDLDNYSESLLKEMLPPKQVQAEFGVPIKTLEYMRESAALMKVIYVVHYFLKMKI